MDSIYTKENIENYSLSKGFYLSPIY